MTDFINRTKNRVIFIALLFLPALNLAQMNDAVFTFGDIDPDAGTMQVMMENTDPVHSFNVYISGIVINEVWGGVSNSHNFNMSMMGNHDHHIHGSMPGMGGDPIEPGTHLLFNVSFDLLYEMTCVYSASCQGNGQSDFDVDLEACYSFPPENGDTGYFSNILNGYLDEYLQFADTSDAAVISYITIEDAVELDFGDDIGLLSFDGSTNYGDCSDEYGEILVGSDYWEGGPLTIPTYGAVDLCDEGGLQYPGFAEGETVSIHVWDANQGIEYAMEMTERDDIPWTPGHIVISDMNFGQITGMTGDIDSDGAITVSDAVIMVSMILGTYDADQQDLIRADITRDNQVDILDVVALVDIFLNQ